MSKRINGTRYLSLMLAGLSFEVPGARVTLPLAINDAVAVTGSYYSATVPLAGFIRGPDGCITTFEVPGSGGT